MPFADSLASRVDPVYGDPIFDAGRPAVLSKLRARLTYANVMATIAVFVALGGSSYAAVTLKKNSVKSRNIAKNAVTSPKVKNGSLLSRDFKTGQLPAGPQGPKGDKGDQGDRAQVIGTDITGTISEPAGAVAAHSCLSADVTVAGAQVGDVPVMAFIGGASAPGGLTFQPVKVTSPDNMTLRLCNPMPTASSAFTDVGVRIITFR